MVLRLDPEAYYDERTLRIMGLDGDGLEAAREAKELRCKEVGGQPVYKGAWLIAWLDRSEAEAAGGKVGAR